MVMQRRLHGAMHCPKKFENPSSLHEVMDGKNSGTKQGRLTHHCSEIFILFETLNTFTGIDPFCGIDRVGLAFDTHVGQNLPVNNKRSDIISAHGPLCTCSANPQLVHDHTV